MPIEKVAVVTQFHKKCACCGVVLHFVKKLSASWFECRNQNCLVWKLGRQADRERDQETKAFLDRLAKRAAARGKP